MPVPNEKALNVDIPTQLSDRFDDLCDHEGRPKKLMSALALFGLTKLSSHKVSDLLAEYRKWLDGQGRRRRK